MPLQSIPGHQVFTHAPIKEAIVDISVADIGADGLAKLEALANTFPEYPNVQPVRLLKIMNNFNPDGTNNSTSESEIIGYQFRAADNSELVTCRSQGFSYHKLKPYTEWQRILPKAIEGWKKFHDKCQPTIITKLTVRNINLIEVPQTTLDLDEYFEAGPTLPTNIDGPMENFFSRTIINFPEHDTKCNVTFAQQPPQSLGNAAFVLDIEAFKTVDGILSLTQINEMLTILNHTKDRVFFGSITQKTKDLFA